MVVAVALRRDSSALPGLEPESGGASGGSEPEAGDSDTEGEDIFNAPRLSRSSHPSGQVGERPERKERLSEGREAGQSGPGKTLLWPVVVAWVLG